MSKSLIDKLNLCRKGKIDRMKLYKGKLTHTYEKKLD
jgi:hypothetical protein